MSAAPGTPAATANRFGSGREVQRVEDAALLAGQGLFVDNVAVENQAHLVFQRSPYAHARIVGIAQRSPGRVFRRIEQFAEIARIHQFVP